MKNKIIIISLLVAIITVIGISIAYFTNSIDIENLFETKPYGTKVDEEFESPDNWLPGTTTPKTLTVTNTGEVEEAVRISYRETWTSKNAKDNEEEGDLALQQGDNKVALINFINPDDWTKVVENNKTYYYYNYKLGPNETTSELLDSVTFNKAITNDYNCVESDTDTSKTMRCKSTGNGYDGATYKLTFSIETVQYDKYKTAWGTNVEIADARPEPEPAPIVAFGLNVNSKNETYETGDKHQMFEFEHAATVQTPALTDYRYIGNDPYNYVYFNCSDLNNQNSTSCETWRIIGVFDVDDGTGNYEQRIKLVRGSGLSEKEYWDERISEDYPSNDWGKNDWNGSLMQTFLTGDYYNRTGEAAGNGLKPSAQNIIDDAIFYLGSLPRLANNSHNSEEMYEMERGITRYNESRPTNWKGKVALMYPSDMYMSYAKGISDICFYTPESCYHGHPGTSWVYKSNITEGISFPDSTWFVTPCNYDSSTVFFSYGGGSLADGGGNIREVVRPVVYLKSSVKIIDGTGESTNPYKLSN